MSPTTHKFPVGQKVMCVVDDYVGEDEDGPKKGGVYTIAKFHRKDRKRCIELAEIPPVKEDYYRFADEVLRVLGGVPDAESNDRVRAKNEERTSWSLELFRPLDATGRDSEWLRLLDTIRDIACACRVVEQHPDGKIYHKSTDDGPDKPEVYARAFRQLMWEPQVLHTGLPWRAEGYMSDRARLKTIPAKDFRDAPPHRIPPLCRAWSAKDIFDAVTFVLDEAWRNFDGLNFDDGPPPGDPDLDGDDGPPPGRPAAKVLTWCACTGRSPASVGDYQK